jgi:hypothetical protein
MVIRAGDDGCPPRTRLAAEVFAQRRCATPPITVCTAIGSTAGTQYDWRERVGWPVNSHTGEWDPSKRSMEELNPGYERGGRC